MLYVSPEVNSTISVRMDISTDFSQSDSCDTIIGGGQRNGCRSNHEMGSFLDYVRRVYLQLTTTKDDAEIRATYQIGMPQFLIRKKGIFLIDMQTIVAKNED